jgi:cobalt transporter subunit CbtB
MLRPLQRTRVWTIEERCMPATLAVPAATHGDALPRRAGLIVQAVLAIALGTLVIGVAGFSHLDVMHNAAHDTRHANGFPCH